jgi:subtilisin family serine protease
MGGSTAGPSGRRRAARLALAALACLAAGPTATDGCGGSERIDRHVVDLHGAAADGLAARVEALGGRVLRLHPEIDVAIVEGLDDAAAAELARGPGLPSLERDARVRMVPRLASLPWQVVQLPAAAAPASHAPEDAAFFALQWNLRQIRADEAFAAGFRGDPAVRVAIVDTGLDPDHVELRGLIDEAASTAFVPSLTGPPDWADDNFHGTHVGGTVVTNGIGINGVAPHTTLVAVKVCNQNGFCTFGDVLSGILYAANAGVDVINMSFTGSFFKSDFGFFAGLLTRTVNFANRHGVLVVGSASNAAADLQHDRNRFVWPCVASSVACIAATGPDGLRAGYSSFGTSEISVAGPGGSFDGVDRFGSMVLGPCSSRTQFPIGCEAGDSYILLQGTSMAAPHVAGAAALLDAQHGGRLGASQLRVRLQATAEDLGKPGADPEYGNGRIDLCRLLGCP